MDMTTNCLDTRAEDQGEDEKDYSGLTATYSPEDNKLRLYASYRLDKALYQRVRDAGFIYAPKQALFVAPTWTPGREDLLIELCGEIGDEDSGLVERAEARADRFEGYGDNRRADANAAHKTARAIMDGIPFGQPILVGHHSERHARRDAARIENNIAKAVRMWDTASYWEQRAAGAVRAAKYKERPDVRARRIKTLEAAKRKQERTREEAAGWLHLWTECEKETDAELQAAVALRIAGACWLHLPRKEGDREDFNQSPTAYDALSNSHPTLYAPRTLAEVFTAAQRNYPATIAHCERWIAHYENRIAYERAMLADAGGTVAEKTRPEKGGACRAWCSPRGGWSIIQKVNKISVTLLDNWNNGGADFTRTVPFDDLPSIMTKAQVDAARAAGRLVGETARGFGLLPEDTPPADTAEAKTEAAPTVETPAEAVEAPAGLAAADVAAMRETLRAGVEVVAVPQLFPTPRDLASRMAALADIQPGERVLEPSAGTGAILGAMGGRMFAEPCATPYRERDQLHAVEINAQLAERLAAEFPLTVVHCADFLTMRPAQLGVFHKILMNPPFENGADIKHIFAALTFLAPGGRLVAICANGPRQNAALRPLVEGHGGTWEELPAGTFANAGTNVSTVLLTFTAD